MSTSILSYLLPPQTISISHNQWTGLRCHRHPLPRHQLRPRPQTLTPILALSHLHLHRFPLSPSKPPTLPSTTAVSAGRSKKKPDGSAGGRIEGSGEIRRRAKENARRRSRRLSQNLFFRRNNPAGKHGDSFTDEELQMIGLGYDRVVRFMDKDDPNLRHPHDWYKYGRYGPYSWRGIVVGPPIRGRFSDERVTLISQVRDHEEWEEIDKYDMAADFSPRLGALNRSIGFRHYWVFVRHPRWRPTELPWQQWTLAAEVVLEAGKDQRLDKWSLMGRLGNKTRALITQCAAWLRPDIIYVKRPVYQCRFEPQDDFFKLLGPLLDPSTENQYPCEVEVEDGRFESCTYFGGLCKIVKSSPKAYVDDVVKAYQKLSEEGKSKCLEFLLGNHPLELLHPYTKEWKVKLEEMEMGCDAPDEDSDDERSEAQITDWAEESDESGGDDDEDEGDEDDDDNEVIDVASEEDDEAEKEETEEFWDDQLKKALSSSDAMENLVKKTISKRRIREDEEQKNEGQRNGEMGVSASTITIDEEQSSRGLRRKVERSRIPPELFLRAAVRPFTYRNLVKEIVLMRHAIIDGDITLTG